MNDLEFRDSKNGGKWLWPTNDRDQWKYINKPEHWFFPLEISNLCSSKNLVIQAGGNAGIYPYHYSKIFNTVITFEPDYKNFTCLSYNAPFKNVYKFQACLGEKIENVGIDYPEHRGEIHQGGIRTLTASGQVPKLTIDKCFNLAPDLIHLDIEGFEGFALEGMQETIIKSKPLIVLETNGSGDQYNYSQEKIDCFLENLGYKVFKKWNFDTAYKFEGIT